VEGLSILTAGRHVESGAELLGGPAFSELISEMRRSYDRIILDTPPVLGLSETNVMQQAVDGVLFVMWTGRTPIKNVKIALESLQSNGANIYGFVMNRLDLSASKNYYQYYYYSNDYYYNYHAIENA
jgi:Mrp family chromosome partitioning ATPase